VNAERVLLVAKIGTAFLNAGGSRMWQTDESNNDEVEERKFGRVLSR